MATTSFHGVSAAREYLLEGHPLTRIEALLLFGLPDLTKLISDLRSERFKIHRSTIPFAATIVRLRGMAEVIPPRDLPIREIMLTEYRASW